MLAKAPEAVQEVKDEGEERGRWISMPWVTGTLNVGNRKGGARKEHTHIPVLEKCLHGRVVAGLAGQRGQGGLRVACCHGSSKIWRWPRLRQGCEDGRGSRRWGC